MQPSPVRTYGLPVAIAVASLFVLIVAAPSEWKSWAPGFLHPELHLGLDLQGGTQLDFRISETEMEKQIRELEGQIAALEASGASSEEIAEKRAQIRNIQDLRGTIVEAIRSVLERRVNSLGVSEAVITPSYYGTEKHLLVECPGVVDIQKCIATVGKTILLEFKEQSTGEDEAHIAQMRELAERAKRRITASGESLVTVGQDLSSTLGVFYRDVETFFRDDLPKGAEAVWTKKPGELLLGAEVQLDPVPRENQLIPHRGILYAEVTGEKKTVDRPIASPEEALAFLAGEDEALKLVKHDTLSFEKLDQGYHGLLPELQIGAIVKGVTAKGQKSILFIRERTEEREEIAASHILVAYKGAVRADPSVTHDKERAREVAEALKARLDAGERFEVLARTSSDGPSAKEGGAIGTFARGTMSPAFEAAAFALKEKGDISPIVETEFGFHIIRLDAPATTIPGSLSFTELLIAGDEAEAKQTSLFEKLQKRMVTKKEEQLPLRTLLFSFFPTGWKDTPLDGKHFRRASVTTDPLTGVPVVQIVFDAEGGELFHELTKRNVGKPIAIFVGGDLISAPTVQAAIPGGTAIITGSKDFDEANTLAQDLNTGAIPAPIHLVGQTTIEASLGDAALRQSVIAGIIGFALVGVYMIGAYRILGIIAMLALTAFAAIYLAILKYPIFFFSGQYVVLTLAGIAGVLLSIGMAIDANILVFERLKEELRKGKLLSTAADVAFRHAWAPIRDSNLSLVITSAILFLVGTSIVRGFAVTLALGIPVSMFTAIIVTRFLLKLLERSPIAENMAAFGVSVSATAGGDEANAPVRLIFLKLSKIFLPLSAALAVVALLTLIVPGPKLSIEFTGGTLMEVQAAPEKTKDEFSSALATFAPSAEPLGNVALHTVENATGPSFLLRLRLLSNEEHIALLRHLEGTLGTVKELKFTTIGPSVSATLKQKAFFALACASAAIILYIALAFRKIPKRLSPLRFGVIAILAPLHTILLMVLIFTALSYWTTFQVDTLFVTALLSIMGYSVNDVIVILDRIRENILQTRGKGDFAELVERSLQQTLRRTLNTGLGALLMLFTLLFFGSESIRWFVLAMILGTFIGTYSSYFIATPLLVLWQKRARRE